MGFTALAMTPRIHDQKAEPPFECFEVSAALPVCTVTKKAVKE
jgi:hypothetical protein